MDREKLESIIDELKKTLIKNGVKDLSFYDKFFENSKKQMKDNKEIKHNDENVKTI
jgi:hypothetical protein